jgi:hypothetical protein
MSKFRTLIIVGLCAAVFPALVSAGGTGACLSGGTAVEPAASVPFMPGGEVLSFALCVDDLTQSECSSIGGQSWLAGTSCLAVEPPAGSWDGTCTILDEPTLGGDVCFLLWVDPQENFTAQELCQEKGQGTWNDDPSSCGAPVPTTPRATLALMILVLLAGSLGILSLRSSSA